MPPPARVLVVAGPTAVGKSGAALRLCEARNGEVVSADSVQLYRGLDVGSNKPSVAERGRVRHHLVDVADADSPWSAGAWCEQGIVDVVIAEGYDGNRCAPHC